MALAEISSVPWQEILKVTLVTFHTLKLHKTNTAYTFNPWTLTHFMQLYEKVLDGVDFLLGSGKPFFPTVPQLCRWIILQADDGPEMWAWNRIYAHGQIWP